MQKLKCQVLVFVLIGFLPAVAMAEKKKDSVFIVPAKKSDLFDEVIIPGVVESKVHADVLSEGQGIVSDFSKNLGESVERGKGIVKLKHTDPVYQYKSLNQTSPVSGVVSKIHTKVGTYVVKGQKLMTITDPSKVEIKARLGIRDLTKVKAGAEGNFLVQSLGETYPVKVVGVSPNLNPATGTAEIELKFLGKKKAPMGSIGRLSFKTNQRSGFLLPEDVLSYQGSKVFVKKIDQEKMTVAKTDVTIGVRQRGQVEILSGIGAEEWVVLRSSGFLKDGSEVEVKNAPKKEADKKEEAK